MRVLDILSFACLLFGVSAQMKSKYKFDMDKQKLSIETRRKEEFEGASDFHQMYKWKLEATGGGFKVGAMYYSKDDGTKSKLQFSSYVKRIVEYKLNDANATDEVFADQEVVGTWKMDKWNDAVYENCESADEEPSSGSEEAPVEETETDAVCKATFATEDGCFTVVVHANLATFQGDSRLQLSKDDVKLDYIFGEGEACEPAAGNALALVGKFDSSAKTKRKNKKAKAEEEAIEESTGEEEIVETEQTEDGASAHFGWLDVVDCGNGKKRKVKSSTSAKGDDDDVGAKEVTWTVYKAKGDGVCTWDPVQGFDAPATGGSAALAASSLTVLLLAVVASLSMA